MPRRQYDEAVKDVKPIYIATDVALRRRRFSGSARKWGAQLPPVVEAWRGNWEYVIPFMAFPPDVGRVM